MLSLCIPKDAHKTCSIKYLCILCGLAIAWKIHPSNYKTMINSNNEMNPFLTVEKGHFSFETSIQISNFKFGYFSYPFDNSIQYQYQSYFFRI